MRKRTKSLSSRDGEVRKHELAEEYLPQEASFRGVFLILVSRFSAPIWEVQSNRRQSAESGATHAFVKQYWFIRVGTSDDSDHPTHPLGHRFS